MEPRCQITLEDINLTRKNLRRTGLMTSLFYNQQWAFEIQKYENNTAVRILTTNHRGVGLMCVNGRFHFWSDYKFYRLDEPGCTICKKLK